MRLLRLQLEDFRGFRSLNTDFDPHLNVFAGESVSGKSSILDALGIFLDYLSRYLSEEEFDCDYLKISDISQISKAPIVRIGIYHVNGPMFFSAQWSEEAVDFLVKPTNEAPLSKNTVTLGLQRYFKELLAQKKNGENTPVLVYYPSTRNFDRMYTRELGNFFLPSSETPASEDQDTQAEGFNSQLQAVYAALNFFLPQFSGLTFFLEDFRMVLQKQGRRFSLVMLSDGEKNLVTLVADIARRLAVANPDLENPLNGKGIVLIDEIGLHLDPIQQKVILPRLREAFPNIQFFVSTYLTQPLQKFNISECLWVLKSDSQTLELSAKRPDES